MYFPDWLVWIYGWSFVMCFVCSYMCYRIANEKGFGSGWAAITGLLCGFLGLIYYAGLPDSHTQKNITLLTEEYLELKRREVF